MTDENTKLVPPTRDAYITVSHEREKKIRSESSVTTSQTLPINTLRLPRSSDLPKRCPLQYLPRVGDTRYLVLPRLISSRVSGLGVNHNDYTPALFHKSADYRRTKAEGTIMACSGQRGAGPYLSDPFTSPWVPHRGRRDFKAPTPNLDESIGQINPPLTYRSGANIKRRENHSSWTPLSRATSLNVPGSGVPLLPVVSAGQD